jgi:hypothetical protein
MAVLRNTYRKILLQYGLHWDMMTGYVTCNIKRFIVKEKFNLLNWGIVDCRLKFFKPPVHWSRRLMELVQTLSNDTPEVHLAFARNDI